jgi:DNA-binding response OmpR family regulator
MDRKPLILLVDDEQAVLTTLSIFLELSGFDIVTASRGDEVLEKINLFAPDIVVLDILMPSLNGREVLRLLRANENWIPVILLTQINGTAERIMALEEGADDYLSKPFAPQELVVRIKAILRRTHSGARSLTSARCLLCQSIMLDRSARRVRFKTQEIALTPKAIGILEYLMLHPDELITRERLLDAVWGLENAVGERVIDTRIAELRKALQDASTMPEYIETVPGQGYRFIGIVEVG